MTNPKPAHMIRVHVEPQRPTPAEQHRLDRECLKLLPHGHPVCSRTRLRILALDRAPRTEFGAAAIVGGPL